MKTLQVITSVDDNTRDLKYLLGILASSLVNFWCVNYLADDMNQSYLAKLPIRPINLLDANDKARYDAMVAKVEVIMDTKKKLAKAKTDKDKTYYENKCAGLDRQIDRLVYDLYGLTEQEIALVEGTKI